MKLTKEEKRIVFHILVHIMKADLIEDPREIQFLDNVFQEFNLDIAEFDHMELMDIDYLKGEFSNFSKEKKEYSKKLFYDMAGCDGYVDPREVEIIEKL